MTPRREPLLGARGRTLARAGRPLEMLALVGALALSTPACDLADLFVAGSAQPPITFQGMITNLHSGDPVSNIWVQCIYGHTAGENDVRRRDDDRGGEDAGPDLDGSYSCVIEGVVSPAAGSDASPATTICSVEFVDTDGLQHGGLFLSLRREVACAPAATVNLDVALQPLE